MTDILQPFDVESGPPLSLEEKLERIADWMKRIHRRLEDLEGEVAAVSNMLHTIHARGVEGPPKRPLPGEGRSRDRDQELREYIDEQKANAATPEEARAAIRGYLQKFKKGDGDEPQLHDSANPRP